MKLSNGKKFLITALSLSMLLFSCSDEEGGEDTTPSSNPQQSSASSGSQSSTNTSGKIEYKPVIGKFGGKRTITSFSPPKTFNVYLAAETSSTDILGQMYVGLVTTDPFTTEVKPELAESWEVKEDKVTYLVKLKKDIFWSDGQPITVDDVVFTFNDVINNPDIPTNSRDGMLVDDQFPKVEKVDDTTVKFVTAKPFVPFLRNALSAAIVPKHILGNLTKKDKSGKVTFNQWGSLNTDPKSLVCNGPFKLKEYVAGQRVILTRNEKYWRKDANGQQLPYLNEFATEIVKDQAVELIKFKAKETDSLFITGQDYEVLKPDEQNLNFKIHNLGPDNGTLFIMFNLSTAKDEKGKQLVDPVRSTWFRDTNFRKALAHALDKDSIIKSVYRGLAAPQWSDVSVQNPYFNPNVKTYPYDLKKAEEMLSAAGYKKNAKGELSDPKGNRIEFDLVTNSGNNLRDAACGIIRADWEKLGIKVNYRPIQFNTMVQQIDETLDWEAMMIGLTGNSIDPHSGINTWRLDGRMHMFNMGNAKQAPAWKGRETSYQQWEKDVLDLFEKASQEFDDEKRKQLYFKSQEIVSENLPYLYTVNKLALVAARNNIGNSFPSINGGSQLNTINWNSYEHYMLTE